MHKALLECPTKRFPQVMARAQMIALTLPNVRDIRYFFACLKASDTNGDRSVNHRASHPGHQAQMASALFPDPRGVFMTPRYFGHLRQVLHCQHKTRPQAQERWGHRVRGGISPRSLHFFDQDSLGWTGPG
jgi:hypothetical protein